jgi:RNA polymerase sigma-70 factor, ECF subfamily
MELLMSGLPDKDASTGLTEIACLVRRTIAGDSTAFEQIISRYERRVLNLSIRLLGTPDDAQDASQEVFLRAFKYIHRLDVQKPIEPWLVRMTINVCRDLRRTRQRRWNTFSEITESNTQPSGDCGNPYTGLAGEQRRQILRNILDTLPERQRTVIILRDVEGLSTSEVAATLRLPEGTVRSDICRARLKMKHAIDQIMGGQS